MICTTVFLNIYHDLYSSIYKQWSWSMQQCFKQIIMIYTAVFLNTDHDLYNRMSNQLTWSIQQCFKTMIMIHIAVWAIHPPIHHPTYYSVESHINCYVETFETELTICGDRGANPDITSNRAAFSPLDQKVLIHYYDNKFDRTNW